MLLLEEHAPAEFVTRFQQTTGAVMAKGVEDTAFYRYVRLLALNEVGGDPGRFGLPVERSTEANAQRAAHLPRRHSSPRRRTTRSAAPTCAPVCVALLVGRTTGRAASTTGTTLNADLRVGDAPDWTEELFLYQTLVGAWPITWERLEPYLVKAHARGQAQHELGRRRTRVGSRVCSRSRAR